MHYLIFYTEYSLNSLIKNIKSIFKIPFNKKDFNKCNKNIYLYNNQEIINSLLNNKNINEEVFLNYNTIQILHFETEFIDCINIINGNRSYILNNSFKNCFIPNNIQINKTTEFIILELDLFKLNQNYSYDFNNIQQTITNFEIIFNKERINTSDNYVDVIILTRFDSPDEIKINALSDYLNVPITKNNYKVDKFNDILLLYDLNIQDYNIFKDLPSEYEDENIDFNAAFHLIIKRKHLTELEIIHESFSFEHIFDDEYPVDYYQQNYILPKIDENATNYDNLCCDHELFMIDLKFKDDVKYFDLINKNVF